jgi:PAS domain S-box-containing protein
MDDHCKPPIGALEFNPVRLAAEHSSASMIVTDPMGRISWVNRGFERSMEFSLAESVGRTPGELLQGRETDPRTVAAMREALSRGEGFMVEILNYTRSGTPVWLHLTVDPVRDASGRLSGFVGLQSDISHGKRVAIELERAKTALAEAQRLARIGSWEWNVATDAVHWSDELFTMFGRSPVDGPPGFADQRRLYEPEGFDRLAAAVQHALSTGDGYRVENLSLIRADGTRRWAEATGSVIRDHSNRIIGLRGTLQDTTSWREIEEARRTADERAQIALDGAGDGIWDWDLAAGSVLYSTRWKSMLGHAEDEIGDQSEEWFDRVHPDDVAVTRERLDAHLCGSTPGYAAEFRMRTRDGGWTWVRSRGGVVSRTRDGAPLRVIGTHSDISAQKTLEAALCTARDQAQAAVLAKSAFMARISHELRTPLNSVIGFGQLLGSRLRVSLTSQQQMWLDRIVSNGHHLLRLIDDVLDLSAIDAQQLAIRTEATDVAALAADVVQSLTPLAAPAVSLHVSGGERGQWHDLDGFRVRQVLLNVVGNALKFTREGHVRIVLMTEARHEGITIDVIDTGCGIAPERVSAIFDAFEQADGTTRRRHGGSGLGLTISRALCEQMGGSLTVESTVGVGTTFRIRLPQAHATAARAA